MHICYPYFWLGQEPKVSRCHACVHVCVWHIIKKTLKMSSRGGVLWQERAHERAHLKANNRAQEKAQERAQESKRASKQAGRQASRQTGKQWISLYIRKWCVGGLVLVLLWIGHKYTLIGSNKWRTIWNGRISWSCDLGIECSKSSSCLKHPITTPYDSRFRLSSLL